MNVLSALSKNKIYEILNTVMDPEIPVLSVTDLGIVRNVELYNTRVIITITPTYSGCPAMDVISMQIKQALMKEGMAQIEVRSILSPAWTTEWMSDAGKKKLKEYGIAPPNVKQQVCHHALFQKDEAVECPLCLSFNTKLVSRFGSTPCKALYQCNDCSEPFDYFKCY